MRIKFQALNSNTKIAYQAAFAVTVATILSYCITLEHSYWSILTAMLMISQTWGEGIKKSFERVGMTIVGGVIGTTLYFYLREHNEILFMVMLPIIFCALYFKTISSLLTNFFVTVAVVFFFALMKAWDLHILEARILETLIGAAIAILTTAVIFPIRAERGLTDIYNQFFQKTTDLIKLSFALLRKTVTASAIEPERGRIGLIFQEIKKRITFVKYEFIFAHHDKNQLENIATKLWLLMHYLTSMLEVAGQLSNKKCKLSYEVFDSAAIERDLLKNVAVLQAALIDTQAIHIMEIISIKPQMQDAILHAVTEQEEGTDISLVLLSFFYYASKVNDVVEELLTAAHT